MYKEVVVIWFFFTISTFHWSHALGMWVFLRFALALLFFTALSFLDRIKRKRMSWKIKDKFIEVYKIWRFFLHIVDDIFYCSWRLLMAFPPHFRIHVFHYYYRLLKLFNQRSHIAIGKEKIRRTTFVDIFDFSNDLRRNDKMVFYSTLPFFRNFWNKSINCRRDFILIILNY